MGQLSNLSGRLAELPRDSLPPWTLGAEYGLRSSPNLFESLDEVGQGSSGSNLGTKENRAAPFGQPYSSDSKILTRHGDNMRKADCTLVRSRTIGHIWYTQRVYLVYEQDTNEH